MTPRAGSQRAEATRVLSRFSVSLPSSSSSLSGPDMGPPSLVRRRIPMRTNELSRCVVAGSLRHLPPWGCGSLTTFQGICVTSVETAGVATSGTHNSGRGRQQRHTATRPRTTRKPGPLRIGRLHATHWSVGAPRVHLYCQEVQWDALSCTHQYAGCVHSARQPFLPGGATTIHMHDRACDPPCLRAQEKEHGCTHVLNCPNAERMETVHRREPLLVLRSGFEDPSR